MNLMITIFSLFFLWIPNLEGSSFLGLDLPENKWSGLGFYLAPYAKKQERLVYENCYTDPQLFLKLPYEINEGSLLTGMGWKGEKFVLKGPGNQRIWCRKNKERVIPELVFYKDLLEARKLYDGQKVWLRQDYFFTWGKGFRKERYPAKKFDQMEVIGVEIAPLSSNRSLLVKLRSTKGFPGFFEINLTAVNRNPPYLGLEEFCYLKEPRELFKISSHIWKKIQAEQVLLGMRVEEVLLAIGDPMKDDGLSPTRTMVFQVEGELFEYVFYKGKLDQILPHSVDGIEMIGNQ